MLRTATKDSDTANQTSERTSPGGGRSGNGARAGSNTVSVLGGGMTVTGDVTGDGELRIEGKVEGSVTTSGRVVVDADGDVEGGIEAQEVIASGKVSGKITAKGAVRLKKGCRVEADIEASAVELEEGGVVNGRVSMTGR